MTNRSIATALAFGFLVFTLPILPATAQTCYYQASADCGPGRFFTGESKVARDSAEIAAWGAGTQVYRCCTKPIKKIGKPETQAEPSQAKADCEGKGPNRRYDLDTGACMKVITKKPEQTEEQSSSEHSSDDSYDDHHHKNKKKKRHHDADTQANHADTQANDKLRQCTKLCEKQCLGMRDVPLDKCVNQCLIGTRC